MADAGHIATDKLLKKLEKDVAREYKIAVEDMESKLTAYLEKTEAQRKVQEGLLKAGKISQKDYSDWCFRHTMMGKRWEQMRDTLAADMHHANEIALGITKDRMPDVYALNANYGMYQIEHDAKIDASFTLYNHKTAEDLLGDQRQLMPKPSTRKAKQIAANKDMQWNKQKIQSAVLQGILQGESPYDVAKRLMQVGQMNYNSAVRYARTMTTSAQNAGRYEAYREAKRKGVELTIEWQATLDMRTRHDHRLMHGQRREVDEPFILPDGKKILYPADCTGDNYELQGEIWNCRCTLLSWVKGFEGDTVKDSPKMGGMSFEEWQHEHEEPQIESFTGKFNKLKEEIANNGGVVTEEYLIKAGELLANEYKTMVAENQVEYDRVVAPFEMSYRRAEKEFKDYQSNYQRLAGILTEQEDKAMRSKLHELGETVINKRDEFYAVRKPYMLSQDRNVKWLASKIGEVRDVGMKNISMSGHLLNIPSKAQKQVEYAYSHYPTDWVRASVNKGNIRLRESNRGYYQHGYVAELAISGGGAKGNAVAIHEVAHRFEHIMPEMLKAERSFYSRRTDGEKSVHLGAGYDKDEYTKRDKFIDKYIGKDYGTGRDYELVSMGFQYAYTDPERLSKDPEYQKWIYGQLLLL